MADTIQGVAQNENISGNLSVTGNLQVDGNVGIGTARPARPLEVKNPDSQGTGKIGMSILGAGFTGKAYGSLEFGVDAGGLNQFPARIQAVSETNGYVSGGMAHSISGQLQFQTFSAQGNLGRDAAAPSTKMTITGSGNVGIGTAAPGYLLDVADRMRVRGGGAGIWFYQNGSDKGFVGMENDNAVGFWGPGAKWGFTMNVNNGDVSYQTLVQHSSRELKEHIVDLSGQEAIEIFEGLTPVKYQLKADKRKSPHIGFVAEDVPDRVANGVGKAIINDHIVAVLTKVVKEQQEQISELKEEVGLLKEELH